MAGGVPICGKCDAAFGKKKGKPKGRKKAAGVWDSSDEDESDGPEYPSWVMKVIG
jgi:NAD-dependent histone deacetylase SIR2